MTDILLEEIKDKVKAEKKYTVDMKTAFQDEKGIVYSEVIKTIYIAEKKCYESKKSKK